MSRKAWAQWLGKSGPEMDRPKVRRTRMSTPCVAECARERHARRVSELEEVADGDLDVEHSQSIAILPVPKPRMTHSDRWNKRPCVLKYRAFVTELRLRGARLPSRYRIEFVLPMPRTWPDHLKARMDGQPHLVRPDTSNLVKAVEDALVPRDERLHDIAASKVWGRKGRIRIYRQG